MVLDFETVRSIGYVELIDGAVYLQDSDQVLTYTMVAKNLARTALSPERSVELIESMIMSCTDPDGPTVLFTRAEMRAWLDGVKAGEFDHLT